MVDGIKNKEHLLSLTLRQLRQEASKLSVPLYSRKTKAVLIDLIVKYQKKVSQISKKISENTIVENIISENKTYSAVKTSKEEVTTKVVFLPRDPELGICILANFRN